MMKINSGTILIAFFAILAGMLGAYAYRQLNRPQPVVEAPAPEAPRRPRATVIPMVSRNLTPGQRITMDDVALVRMTKQQMEDAGLGKKAFMTNPEQIIGKLAKNALRRGSTFDTRDFYPPGTGPGIAHRLKPGLRAVTVSMSPINALLGFAGAGQSVDVMFHYGQGTSQAGATVTGYVPPNRQSRVALGAGSNVHGATSTLVQGAEILALNQSANPTGNSSGVSADQRSLVTLAVYPREAELLRVAGEHGELSLSLRNPTDNKPVPLVDPRTVDEIINVRSSVREMEIYRGKDVSRLQFASVGGINRRLVDGTRDNKLTEAIEQAKLRAQLDQVSEDKPASVHANHSPDFKRDIELAPVISSGPSTEPKSSVVEPAEAGVELNMPAANRW